MTRMSHVEIIDTLALSYIDGCVLADASQAPRAKHAAAGIVLRGGASDMPHAHLPLSVLMRRLVPLKPALE